MCLNCGCGLLDEQHDRSENLITEDLRRAAAANGQTLEQTAANVMVAAQRLAGTAGSSEQDRSRTVGAAGGRA